MSQVSAAGVPFRSRMIEFGEFDPADVDRMEVEREDDLVFSARVASLNAALTPTPSPETPTPPATGQIGQEPDVQTGDRGR